MTMPFFDVSRNWVILAPAKARPWAEELSRCLGLLRDRAGLSPEPPAVEDAAAAAPEDWVPVIVLNAGDLSGGGPCRNGFSWRLGRDRLEIYSASGRGLWNGVFDFLDALGIRWPDPDREELPPTGTAPQAGNYPLTRDNAYSPSAASPLELQRLIVSETKKTKDRERLFRWAARNRIDAVIFSLRDKRLFMRPRNAGPDTAGQYALGLEAGGWDLSLLVPRRFFLFRRELFRMESGKRVKSWNFCPTNPETIALLKKEAARRFRAILDIHPEILVWHLWPDRGQEKTWCSCPACRAFSAEDQNRIAVNAAADVLSELAPAAKISLYETPGGAETDEKNNILPRPNVFKITADYFTGNFHPVA